MTHTFDISDEVFTKYGLKKRTNELGSNVPTFALKSKKTDDILSTAFSLEGIADFLNPRKNGCNFLVALENIELLFPDTMSLQHQIIFRKRFLQKIFNNYFQAEHAKILSQGGWWSGSALSFHKKKSLMNREKLARYPVLCTIAINSKFQGDALPVIDLLASTLGQKDYTFDVMSLSIGSISNQQTIFLALDSKASYHYLTLSLDSCYSLGDLIDFSKFLEQMNKAEDIIKHKFLGG